MIYNAASFLLLVCGLSEKEMKMMRKGEREREGGGERSEEQELGTSHTQSANEEVFNRFGSALGIYQQQFNASVNATTYRSDARMQTYANDM